MAHRETVLWTLLVLVAVCLATVITASVATAETTLLAEWLINGSPVTSLIPFSLEGTVQLGSSNVFQISCSGIFDGSFDPEAGFQLTAILSLSGTQVTLAAPLLCKSSKSCEESATDIEMAPEGLPWSGSMKLMETGSFLGGAEKSTYFISCLIIGIKVSEECTFVNAQFEIINVAGGVEWRGEGAPLGSCTSGGANSGQFIFASGNLMTPNAGGTVSGSSE
jgi:hypothetical protein